MKSFKSNLLRSAAALPVALGLAAGVVAIGTVSEPRMATAACNPCAATKAACNPCAAAKACNPCNPCAATKAAACNPCSAAKACNPCNPCSAAKACNPCNPCSAAKACNPCNPCSAAKACNPCNPCKAACGACNPCNPCSASAGGAPTGCYVPRLKTAAVCNPCAAAKACNPCNPCSAAKACNPCNPCAAAKACNPCNPCSAAKACNPCNPCAAAKACNPCAAAKACNPCNPCAAAKACNPCNPCNPCAAAESAELTSEEAVALYDCLKPVMAKSYTGGKHWAATRWKGFTQVTTQPYASATHGGRQVQNLVNKIGLKAYKKFDDIKAVPVGSTMAKPSFTVGKDGEAKLGPLFIMEKMTRGFNADTSNWRYAAILPGGNTMGVTKSTNSAGVGFCHECHVSGEDNDFLLLAPEEYRVK